MELGLSKLAKALVGVALAASVLAGGTAPAPVATTFHHPFYDITQAAFVDAVGLKVGDHLQTADGGEATVENVTPYHSTEMTYDLTIGQLHTYYVEAGDTPILVHNCGTTDVYRTAKLGNGVDERANGLDPRNHPINEATGDDGSAWFGGNRSTVETFADPSMATHENYVTKFTVENEFFEMARSHPD